MGPDRWLAVGGFAVDTVEVPAPAGFLQVEHICSCRLAGEISNEIPLSAMRTTSSLMMLSREPMHSLSASSNLTLHSFLPR